MFGCQGLFLQKAYMMLRSCINLYLLFFVISSVAASENSQLTCISGKIKVTAFGDETIQREKFCFDKDFAGIYSSSCRKNDCQAFKNPKRYYPNELYTKYGSPGFKLCRALQGTPEIIEFYAEKEWHGTDRCTFSDGFVDTDTLLDYYLDRLSGHP